MTTSCYFDRVSQNQCQLMTSSKHDWGLSHQSAGVSFFNDSVKMTDSIMTVLMTESVIKVHQQTCPVSKADISRCSATFSSLMPVKHITVNPLLQIFIVSGESSLQHNILATWNFCLWPQQLPNNLSLLSCVAPNYPQQFRMGSIVEYVSGMDRNVLVGTGVAMMAIWGIKQWVLDDSSGRVLFNTYCCLLKRECEQQISFWKYNFLSNLL